MPLNYKEIGIADDSTFYHFPEREIMDIRDIIIAVLLVVVISQLTHTPLRGNEEVVEWVDYRGNPMKVSTSRSLHNAQA